jgi:hypothetical protein
MRDMKFMRDLIGTSALALIFSIGVAAAQTSQPAEPAQAPNMQQTSPQGAPNQDPSDSNVTRDGTIAPSEDEIVGPPEAEAGQRDAENLAGSPTGDATGGHRDMSEIPGATPQTMPAKYSQENADRLDYSIMGYPVQLSDEQKQAIWKAVGDRGVTANTVGTTIHAETGVFLPPLVQGEEFPTGMSDSIAELQGLKYVRVDDKILLIKPSNGIVRAVIEE